MLWELFVGVGAAMFIVVAVQAAGHSNAGIAGFVLAFSVGVLLAVAYEVVAHKIANSFVNQLQRRSRPIQNWSYGLLYAAPAIFPLVIAYFGDRVFTAMLRFR